MLAVYSDACKHAMRALVHLARLGPQGRAAVCDFLAEDDYPEAALAKVLQLLAARGILTSVRGAGGGFELARSADKVRLADIIAAIDGNARANSCALGETHCVESSWCPIHHHWFKARTLLSDMMRSTTVADLVERWRAAKEPPAAGARSRSAAAEVAALAGAGGRKGAAGPPRRSRRAGADARPRGR